jgi:hypothetical protein
MLIMTVRVLWTWDGNYINSKDFEDGEIDEAYDFRDSLENQGAGVQRLFRV